VAEPQHDVAELAVEMPEKVLAALGDLEVAQEELRVAEEELDQQRQQIERLIALHDSGQRWRDHLFALLPVGVLVTDAGGTILEINASAAELLGVRAVHLPGKPLLVYVAAAHRRLVRDLLSRLGRGEPELHAAVQLVPRAGEPVSADLIALPDPEGPAGTLRWVVLPRDGGASPVAPAPTAARAEPSDESLQVATALAQLFSLPADVADQQRLLGRIALVVRAAVPGVTSVSVTIGDPAEPDRQATDSAEAQVFDGLQLRTGEGPCVDAFRDGTVTVSADVAADPRWPALARVARSQPIRSTLALPIRVADERTGVLNLYSSEHGAFVTQAVRVGEIVASAVAAVLRDVSERASLQALIHHLERALHSRAVIEQAKGIVIAHHGGTADEAFARLVAFSSRQNVKLRDLAELIVREGGTPPLKGL
jgi:PAS domain S-box-containing protein